MASSLDEETVRHVARLARLAVNDEEIARFAAQLSTILEYIEQLNQLDTTDIPPTTHPLPVSNVFREDSVHPTWDQDGALRNAPESQNGHFRVPKVLDQERA